MAVLLPGLVIAVVSVAALAAPLTGHDPVRVALADRMLPPAWLDGGTTQHLLGTDSFGRDVLTRVLYGARISLIVALSAIALGAVVGTAAGIVSGCLGGAVESFLMRVVDLMLSLPVVLIAIALAVAVGPSTALVTVVIAGLVWPRFARQIRGETLQVVQHDYVRYARAVGVPTWRVMLRHVLPNVAPTLLVLATLELGRVILLEASLSFLGSGVPPPHPSWGGMIAEGQGLIRTGWWIVVAPGLAVMLTVLSFNALGDWLRERLDPRLRQR